MSSPSWLVIGISGATCGGKTTLAKHLHSKVPNSYLIQQDDYFLPIDSSKHTFLPELNHINWEILSSLDMEKMENDIFELIKDSRPVNGISNLNNNFDSLMQILTQNNIKLLIVEGFSIFNYKSFENLFHLKYFLTLTHEVCWDRRSNRVYDPPDVPGYFDKIVWPHYVQIKDEVIQNCIHIEIFDGVEPTSKHYEKVIRDVCNILAQKQQ